MYIANLLKYCPKGTKLYSPIWGEVEFIEVASSNNIVIKSPDDNEVLFYCSGAYHRNGECVLFPSKDQRDWSKFRLPLKRGDIMMKADGTIPFIASGEFYEDTSPKYICGVDSIGYFSTGIYGWTSEFYIPASEEAKKELFDKMAEAGYKWNANTLEIEKKIESEFKEGDVVVDSDGYLFLVSAIKNFNSVAVHAILYANNTLVIHHIPTVVHSINEVTLASIKNKNKFYSTLIKKGYIYDKKQHKLVKQEFKPFDRVLVRDKDTDTWEADIYLGYNEENKYCPYKCASMNYQFCIPYEGNEYLLGTTGSPT